MGRKRNTEVIVVGAGPVGKLTALTLRELGIDVRLLDQGAPENTHDHPIALQPPLLALFQDLGLDAELLERGRPVETMGICPRHGTQARVDVVERSVPLLVVSQADLDDVLERRLATDGLEIEWMRRVSQMAEDAGGVTLEVDRLGVDSGGYPIDTTLYVVEKVTRERAGFVVGADGFHSTIRRRADIGIDTQAPVVFAEVGLRTDGGLGTEARLVLDDDTTSLLLPLPEHRAVWLLELRGEDARAPERLGVAQRAFEGLSHERLDLLLRERAPWFAASAEDLEWSLRVQFEPALAQRFGRGRIWLAGDAAHVSSPIGMRSLNRGLLESRHLAAALHQALRTGSFGMLEDYHDRHSEAWRDILTAERGLRSVAQFGEWARGNARELWDLLPRLADLSSGDSPDLMT